MPKRFLKPGITTSGRWNECDWMTQTFYIRLLTLVDDYGRYDARPQILRSHAFPLHPKITTEKIVEMCEELAKNDLVSFYKSGDKFVLQLLRWEERVRSASKFPSFDNICVQLYANASNCSPPPPSPSPSPSPSPTATAAADGDDPLRVPEGLQTNGFREVWDKWVPFRRKMKSCKDWRSLFQSQLDWLGGFPESTAQAIVNQSIRNGWQGLFPLSDEAKVKKRPSINI